MSLKIWLYVALYKLSICLGCESWMLWSLWWTLHTNKWLCNLKWPKNVLMYNYIYYNTNVSVLWVVICLVYWTWCNVWAVSALFTTLSKEKRDSHTTSGMNGHIEDLLTKCFYCLLICKQWGCFYQNVQCLLHSRVWISEQWRDKDADCIWPGKMMEGCCVATEGGWKGRIKEAQRQGGGRGYTVLAVQWGQWKPFIKNVEHSHWATRASHTATVQLAYRNGKRTRPACNWLEYAINCHKRQRL